MRAAGGLVDLRLGGGSAGRAAGDRGLAVRRSRAGRARTRAARFVRCAELARAAARASSAVRYASRRELEVAPRVRRRLPSGLASATPQLRPRAARCAGVPRTRSRVDVTASSIFA